MNVSKEALRMYLVTDRAWEGEESLEAAVEASILGGTTCVQIREKNLDSAPFIQRALPLKALCGRHGIPFIVNDDLEVAQVIDADGIHVGQKDLDAKWVREQLGTSKIMGVSVQTVEQAQMAVACGADYLGVGAMFPTDTKGDADAVSLETLKAICQEVSIPVVAIGGISEATLPKLEGTGIDGIAVVSAVLSKPNKAAATKTLLEQLEMTLGIHRESGDEQ